MKYRVLQAIWHTKDERHYEPGDVCEMGHLGQEWIDLLVARGVIAPTGAEGAPRHGEIRLDDGVNQQEATLAGKTLRAAQKQKE